MKKIWVNDALIVAIVAAATILMTTYLIQNPAIIPNIHEALGIEPVHPPQPASKVSVQDWQKEPIRDPAMLVTGTVSVFIAALFVFCFGQLGPRYPYDDPFYQQGHKITLWARAVRTAKKIATPAITQGRLRGATLISGSYAIVGWQAGVFGIKSFVVLINCAALFGIVLALRKAVFPKHEDHPIAVLGPLMSMVRLLSIGFFINMVATYIH